MGHGEKTAISRDLMTDEESSKREGSLRIGAFEFLQKPIKINELIQYIQRAYKNKLESNMAS